MMQAVEITQPGGPEVLALTERPMPEPAHDQVVIKVAYAGVNRPDILQRTGSYPPPPDASPFMGLEVSGTVVAVGDADVADDDDIDIALVIAAALAVALGVVLDAAIVVVMARM